MLQFTLSTKDYHRGVPTISLSTRKVKKISTSEPHWRISQHLLNNHTLLYMRRGHLSVKVGNHAMELNEPDALYIAPGRQFGAVSDDSPVSELYIVEFDCSDFMFFNTEYGYFKAVLPAALDESFYIMNEHARASSKKHYLCDAHLLTVLDNLSVASEHSDTDKQMIYESVCKYISANITSAIDVQTIADSLKYNKDYLGRIVRQIGNTTIKQLIIREKVQAAKNLLVLTDFSLEKIALQLQFNNVNDFQKFFKYHTSTTPHVYRKSHM